MNTFAKMAKPLFLINAAHGKIASMSSCFPRQLPYNDPTLALNDNGKREYAFHTDKEDSPWWIVDLKNSYSIHYIIVGNRRKKQQGRAATLTVEISEDAVTWTTIHTGLLFWHGNVSFPLKGRVSARYVKLSLQNSEYLHLSKVEVWAPHKMEKSNTRKIAKTETDVKRRTTLKREAEKGQPTLPEGLKSLQKKPEAFELHNISTKKPVSRKKNAWTIDLGDLYPIEYIEIFKKKGIPLNLLQNMKIEYSQTGQVWNVIHDGLLYWGNYLAYPLQGEVLARFIRISNVRHPKGIRNFLQRIIGNAPDVFKKIRILSSRIDIEVESLRSDGLGCRMITLLNAMYLSKMFAGNFKFIWPQDKHVPSKDHHLTPRGFDSAAELFNNEFCEKHLLQNKLARETMNLVDGKKAAKKISRRDLINAFPETLNAPRTNISTWLHCGVSPQKGLMKYLFLQISFTKEIRDFIERAYTLKLPPNYAAVHIRSGDIVYYPSVRSEILSWGVSKALPIQLGKMSIEMLLKKKRNIILFSDDRKSIEMLSATYKIPCASNYIPQVLYKKGYEAAHTLFEVILLSRATDIYTSPASRFADFAVLISDVAGLQRWDAHRIFSPDAIVSYMEKDLNNNSTLYHDLQNAYSYAYLYHLTRNMDVYHEHTRYLRKCVALDPENVMYKVYLAITLYKMKKFTEAEDMLKNALKIDFDIARTAIDCAKLPIDKVKMQKQIRRKHIDLEALESVCKAHNLPHGRALLMMCYAHIAQPEPAAEWKVAALSAYQKIHTGEKQSML